MYRFVDFYRVLTARKSSAINEVLKPAIQLKKSIEIFIAHGRIKIIF